MTKTIYPYQFPVEHFCVPCRYYIEGSDGKEAGEHCRVSFEEPKDGAGQCGANASWNDKKK